MKDLLPGPSSKENRHVIQMAENTTANLKMFFHEVESVKEELKELERLHLSLRTSNQRSKTLHTAEAVRDIRSRIDIDVALSLHKANLIKARLEALHRSNQAALSVPGCGPGSSSDRTRTSVVNALMKNLKESMNSFNNLREQISSEYRDTVQRRFYAVTGETPDEKTVDVLISTGKSESLLQKAIQQQGKASVIDAVKEIEERYRSVKEIERSLNELQQVFLHMAVVIQTQGEELDDIESHVARASEDVNRGVHQLQIAREQKQKNSRKRTVFAIILLIIISVLVLPVILRAS